MKPPGETEIWTPPRLRARLTALKGLAPAPSCYVIWRSTTRPGSREVSGYELPGESGRHPEATFERFLAGRKLAGAERLSVSVLAIREQLDDAGLIREGVLERRRGSVEGPYYGNVARVEFTGPARLVRRYQAQRDGRLTELPAENDASALSPSGPSDPEGFAGEDEAVHAWLGTGAVITAHRAPSLFEDLLGLSAIIHARRRDGTEAGCGVGWHGGVAFVLVADFPRHDAALAPPPDLEAAVDAAVAARDLIRLETRLDDLGFCVIARVRGQSSLVVIRLDGAATRIDPYTPGRLADANDDQRRWMTYAETYEARVILDSWRAGDDDRIAVLTVDPDQEAWRHIIDSDGVEVSRQSDNDAAAAVLYREQINPPDETPVAGAERMAETPPDTIPWIAVTAPDFDAPADSLLTAALAWSRASELLSAVIASVGQAAPEDTATRLRALIEPLTALRASFSVASLRRLATQIESGRLPVERFAEALDDLVTRLRDELALTRIVTVPVSEFRPDGEPPFGLLVERHFPAAAYDIQEATRCLALRRATASVSHAMKVMRIGLTAAEDLLSTPHLPDLSWARMISAMRGGDGDHQDLLDAINGVRRAWRAPGLTPADRYSEEEAEAVLASVAAFMRLMAAKLDALKEAPAG